MKFLLVVLAIHFGIEVIAKRNKAANNAGEINGNIRHPAEFNLR
jgi:hypothetical protein